MKFRFRIRTIFLVTALLALALVLGRAWVYSPGVNVNMLGPSTFKVEGNPVTPDDLPDELKTYAEGLGRSRPRLLRIYVVEGTGVSSDDVSKTIEIGSAAGFESFAIDHYSDSFLGNLDF